MISTQNMSWDKEKKTLSIEASTLQLDKVPWKLEVQSHHTGKVKEFRRTSVKVDVEQEIQYWKFRSYPDNEIWLIIFND